MKNTKIKRWLWVFAGLSVAMAAFIWGHSMMSRDQSSDESLSILAFLFPVLRWIGIEDPDTAHLVVRKLAHFAEFGALGLFVGGFAVNLGRIKGQRFISLPLLIVLSVAVMDEFIQLFSGRAAMVQDVMLDFAGGITGLCFAALCYLILKKKAK